MLERKCNDDPVPHVSMPGAVSAGVNYYPLLPPRRYEGVRDGACPLSLAYAHRVVCRTQNLLRRNLSRSALSDFRVMTRGPLNGVRPLGGTSGCHPGKVVSCQALTTAHSWHERCRAAAGWSRG